MSRVIEILVVDDHQLIRIGAVDMLSNLSSDALIYDAATLSDAKQLLTEKGSLDLILLDLVLPDTKDFEGLKSLKALSPETPVAIVSGVLDREQVRVALANGADGYIPKTSSSEVMLQAVRLILQGEVFIPSLYLRDSQPTHNIRPKQQSLFLKSISTLTDRQMEVLELLNEGLSNKEIAKQLDCAESTVKTHVSAILAISGESSRGKLVAAYVEEKYAESRPNKALSD